MKFKIKILGRVVLIILFVLAELSSPARADNGFMESGNQEVDSLSRKQSGELVEKCNNAVNIAVGSMMEKNADLVKRGVTVIRDKLGENQRYLENACEELPKTVQEVLNSKWEGQDGVSEGEFINQIIRQVIEHEFEYFNPFASCSDFKPVGLCFCRRGIFGRPSIVISARAPVSIIENSDHIYQTELPKILVDIHHQMVSGLLDSQLRQLLKLRIQQEMFLVALGISIDSGLNGGDPTIPAGFLNANIEDDQIELALTFMKYVVENLGASYFFDSGDKMSIRWPLIALPKALDGIWGLKVAYPLGIGIGSKFKFDNEGFRRLGLEIGGGRNLNGDWFFTSFIDNYLIPIIMGNLGKGATKDCTSAYIKDPNAYMRRSMLESMQNYHDATVDMTRIGFSDLYLQQGESQCHLPFGNGNLAPLGPSRLDGSSELAAVLNSAIRWTNYDCSKTGGGRSYILREDRFRMLEGHEIGDIEGKNCLDVTKDDLAQKGNEFNRDEFPSQITKSFHLAKHVYCYGCPQNRVKFATRKLDYRNHCKWHK